MHPGEMVSQKAPSLHAHAKSAASIAFWMHSFTWLPPCRASRRSDSWTITYKGPAPSTIGVSWLLTGAESGTGIVVLDPLGQIVTKTPLQWTRLVQDFHADNLFDGCAQPLDLALGLSKIVFGDRSGLLMYIAFLYRTLPILCCIARIARALLPRLRLGGEILLCIGQQVFQSGRAQRRGGEAVGEFPYPFACDADTVRVRIVMAESRYRLLLQLLHRSLPWLSHRLSRTFRNLSVRYSATVLTARFQPLDAASVGRWSSRTSEMVISSSHFVSQRGSV